MKRSGMMAGGVCAGVLAAASLALAGGAGGGGAGGGGAGGDTVVLSVVKNKATEGADGRGSLAAFKIHSSEAAEVLVNLQWNGTATMGSQSGGGEDVDYQYIPDAILVQPGDNVVVIRTYDDANAESVETVTLKILPGEGYTVDGMALAKSITIESNE